MSDSKKKLTEREEKFLELYFQGNSMKDAARLAGYKGSTPQALCNQGSVVIRKFEGLANHKDIFRRIGAGETRIAQMLLKMAEEAESETVRLNALNIITKCLGLQREHLDLNVGAEIIIRPASRGPSDTPRPRNPGGAPQKGQGEIALIK